MSQLDWPKLPASPEAEMSGSASPAERNRLSGDIDAINRRIDRFPFLEHQEGARPTRPTLLRPWHWYGGARPRIGSSGAKRVRLAS